MYVAEHYLGLEVEEREVYLDEVKDLQSVDFVEQQQLFHQLARL